MPIDWSNQTQAVGLRRLQTELEPEAFLDHLCPLLEFMLYFSAERCPLKRQQVSTDRKSVFFYTVMSRRLPPLTRAKPSVEGHCLILNLLRLANLTPKQAKKHCGLGVPNHPLLAAPGFVSTCTNSC